MNSFARIAKVAPSVPTGQAPQVEAARESSEACWRRSLETAGNLLCRMHPDEMSTVSVVLPLSGQVGEVQRLEALGKRLAAERELAFRARTGLHSVTITLSNRV